MKSYLLFLSVALFLAGCGGSSGGEHDSGNNGGQEIDGGTESSQTTDDPTAPQVPNDEDEIPSPTNSSACFNETFYQVGTIVSIELEQRDGGVQLPNYSETSEVTRVTSYRGYSDVFEQSITSGSSTSTLYILADTLAKSVTTLGQLLDGEEITYHPSGLLLDYDIALGETKNYPTVTERVDGAESSSAEYSFEYLRTDRITVPAGTFDTCVMVLTFESTSPDGTASTTEYTQYIGIGNGLMIREDYVITTSDGNRFTGSDTLVSATINGNPI
ncbi:hypothetical protein K6Q96_18135 [Grimontia kaedaensis]|uniref:Uncharacterized protein n=1 Tax=Grimontia kaedaensis TaxID=2872157 RepID=A0ABY4X1Q4_9GAMM|nr:hypothetical protein [Grimontia kaedaensis]USH05141.1 hypothetical protein K6Q96_18135 [Grimontia kaedaensis]